MAKQLVVQDVADVILTDIASKKVMANTYMQISGLSGTVDEEDLRAGIGNGKIFTIRTDKDIELNFTSAVFDPEFLAMTQGVELENEKEVLVTRATRGCVDAEGKIEIEGIAENIEQDSIKATVDGEPIEITEKNGLEITVDADEDQTVIISYQEKVTGEGIDFDASKFSRKVRVDMRTIAYDLETGEIYSDIYFVFREAMPGGDFDLSFEAGSVITPEFTASVLVPKCGSVMGEMVSVPRVTKTESEEEEEEEEENTP